MTGAIVTPEDLLKRASEISTRVRSIDSVKQLRGFFTVDSIAISQRNRLMPVLKEGTPRPLQDGNKVSVSLEFAFDVLVPRDEGEGPSDEAPLARVTALFEVRYKFDSDDPIDEDALQAFAELNGRFNLTPYWRAYLNDSLTRSGLPSFSVPPFHALKRVADLAEKIGKQHAKSSGGDTETKLAGSAKQKHSGDDDPPNEIAADD